MGEQLWRGRRPARERPLFGRQPGPGATSVGNESRHLDRFGLILTLTIISVAALSLIDVESVDTEALRSLLSLTLSLITGVTLLLALRASGVVSRWLRVADIIVALIAVLTVVSLVIELLTDVDVATAYQDRPSLPWVLMSVVAPIAVVRRLLQHRRVTMATLAGAVAAHLLIAVAACYVFLALDTTTSSGFFGTGRVPTHEFMYFSLVTITTLGYGDLAPVHPLGRFAATSEALIGQVYLVTFVAMVVGLLIAQRDADPDA